jgi:hypothetical protein
VNTGIAKLARMSFPRSEFRPRSEVIPKNNGTTDYAQT